MFSQFFVQIFALYKFFRKNLRKKRRKFSMDPICETYVIFCYSVHQKLVVKGEACDVVQLKKVGVTM